MDEARVKFLVRPDAWAAWTALHPPEQEGALPGAALLAAAFTEYGDERLVAAYVLQSICEDTRRQASEAAEAAQAVKGIEVGPIKVQLSAASTGKALADTAAGWCARAADLRAEVARSTRTTVRTSRSVVVQPELA